MIAALFAIIGTLLLVGVAYTAAWDANVIFLLVVGAICFVVVGAACDDI